MALKDLLSELAKLSPEDREALKAAFAPEEPKKPKLPPENPRAKTVFFFRHNGKIIPTNIREASKLYWVRRYEYLGFSSGETWKQKRSEGKSVAEAQEAEYQAMLLGGRKEPPPDLRNTNFGKANMFSVERALNSLVNSNKDLDFKKEIADAVKDND